MADHITIENDTGRGRRCTVARHSRSRFIASLPNDNGQHITITIDNRWVVPDNAALSLKYGSHINVEYVSNNRVAMYLCKNTYKGSTLVAFPPYV